MFQPETGLGIAAAGIGVQARALGWTQETGRCWEAPAFMSKDTSGFFSPIHIKVCVGRGDGFGEVS